MSAGAAGDGHVEEHDDKAERGTERQQRYLPQAQRALQACQPDGPDTRHRREGGQVRLRPEIPVGDVHATPALSGRCRYRSIAP